MQKTQALGPRMLGAGSQARACSLRPSSLMTLAEPVAWLYQHGSCPVYSSPLFPLQHGNGLGARGCRSHLPSLPIIGLTSGGMDIPGETPHRVQSQTVGWSPGDFCCGTKCSGDAGQGDKDGGGVGRGQGLDSHG